MIIGIDPGHRGALAVIDCGPAVEALYPLSTIEDLPALLLALDLPDGRLESVVIERQQAMPRQGLSALNTLMFNYGRLVGRLEATVPQRFCEVPPQAWKRTAGLLSQTPAFYQRRWLYGQTGGTPRRNEKVAALARAYAVPNFAACLPYKTRKDVKIGMADATLLALAAVQGKAGFEAYRWRFGLPTEVPIDAG